MSEETKVHDQSETGQNQMSFTVTCGKVVGGGGGKMGESPLPPKSPFPQELARMLRYHFIT